VSTNDLSLLSVLQFSVEVLRVPNIIVCGHYGCGGVQAAMKNEDTGMLGNWLKNIREVYLLHKAELDLITDEVIFYSNTVHFPYHSRMRNRSD